MSVRHQGERRIRGLTLSSEHSLVEQLVLEKRALFQYDPDGFLSSDASLRQRGRDSSTWKEVYPAISGEQEGIGHGERASPDDSWKCPGARPGGGEGRDVNPFTPARRLAPLLLSLAAATGSAQSPGVPDVTPGRLLSPTPGEWLVHGRTYDNQRYSPLTQITTANVARLSPRWIFQLAGARDGIETTPIVADGVMYLTTSHNRVFAFDLRSRKKLWQYEHKLGHAVYCCGPVNRGLAIAGSRVFMATLDARLVALDRASGEVVWNVQTDDPDSAVSHTMAPLVVDSIVIVGAAGGEYGIRGSVSGYDVRDGHRVWRWYAVPSPEEGGWWGKWATQTPTGEDLHRDIARERADSAKFADSWRHGGAPVWTTPAYDSELGLIYFGVGNPSPSNDGEGRPGDNLYNNSTVALDVRTGTLRWYHQHVPHDLWEIGRAHV